MSNYRDDMNDTLRLQEQAFFRTKGKPVDEQIRLQDETLHRFVKLAGDTAKLGDEILDRRWVKQSDAVALDDAIIDQASHVQLVVDSLPLADQVIFMLTERVDDAFGFSETMIAALRAQAADKAKFEDKILGKRKVKDTVSDGFRLGDKPSRLLGDTVSDTLKLSETTHTKARAVLTVIEALKLGETVAKDGRGGKLWVADGFTLKSEAFGTLSAADTVLEAAIAFTDDARQHDDVGQAWTASMSEWAMSRFAPFTFTGIAVIDGTVYLTSQQGVFALDSKKEDIEAELQTGALDMTGNELARPVSAYLEYELDGSASFGVTQTQTGTKASYEYDLAGRPQAGTLTNARAQFGRGLRGRHFSYSVKLTGKHGYINDWSVLFAPVNRRI